MLEGSRSGAQRSCGIGARARLAGPLEEDDGAGKTAGKLGAKPGQTLVPERAYLNARTSARTSMYDRFGRLAPQQAARIRMAILCGLSLAHDRAQGKKRPQRPLGGGEGLLRSACYALACGFKEYSHSTGRCQQFFLLTPHFYRNAAILASYARSVPAIHPKQTSVLTIIVILHAFLSSIVLE